MNKEEIEQTKEHYIFTTKHELDDDNKKLKKYIRHLEQKSEILDKVIDNLEEVGNKYIKEYKDVEKLDLIQQNTIVLQELSCVIDDIEDILEIIEGEKK